MADHLSDEEQLEALKKWWKTNGTSLLLMIVLAAGGWFGWNYWQDGQQRKAEESAVFYMAMLDALQLWEQDGTEDNASVVAAHAETLKNNGEGTRYALYAAMTVARLAAAAGDYENASAELEWVLSNSEEEALNALVNLRLAEIEYNREELDRALALLNKPHPEEYRSLYEELKGDILAANGDTEGASTAYRVALDSLGESDPRARALLELKLNELTPAGDESAAIGKEET